MKDLQVVKKAYIALEGLDVRFCMKGQAGGFTLVEMMMVLIILSIAAAIAIPFATSGSSTQLKSAANIISTDLEYAKSMAISRGQEYKAVFDAGSESYQLEDSSGVIQHPVSHKNYAVNFASDSRLSRVSITSAVFDGGSTVQFNYLGSPLDGTGSALNSGVITLTAAGETMTINIEPVTGYITIN